MLLEVQSQFEASGYALVRQLLPKDCVTELTRQLAELSGLSEPDLTESGGIGSSIRRRLPSGWTLPDGVTKRREFWPVIFAPQLVRAIRSLLGPDARFLQHTDLHVGYSSFNWHRDSVSRTYGRGTDWEESKDSYGIVRVGVYLRLPNAPPVRNSDTVRCEAERGVLSLADDKQEPNTGGFRFGVIPGTHRPPLPGQERERRKIERYTGWMSHIYRWMRGENPVPPGTEWIEPRSGDAVIFDPRVIHTGTPADGPKFSLFLAYGIPNAHARNHVHYYRHLRPELGYEEIPSELVERLKSEGLYFDPPCPESVAGASKESRVLSWIAKIAGLRQG